MILSKDNYFGPEADKEYFSVSQFKSFKECEAKTVAKLNGEWIDTTNDAFLIGSYVHAWNEGALETFKEQHPEMYSSKGKTKGQLKANFLIAEKMIETLQRDEAVNVVREGQKEVIMTGDIFNTPFKIMIDIYNPEREVFVDLKTTRSITQKYWNEKERYKQNFIEYYDYLLQMAVYAEIERQNRNEDNYFQPHIIAVSKEEFPDKAIILIGTEFIEEKLLEVQTHLDRFKAIKKGEIKPTRCEKCDYCRSTKKLKQIIHYLEL